MIKIVTQDGRRFEKQTAPQIVGVLWKDAFLQETTPDRYMRAVAQRLGALGEEPPRTDSAQHFLEDLALLKVITIEEQ